jgi:uncharacterized membrane protein
MLLHRLEIATAPNTSSPHWTCPGLPTTLDVPGSTATSARPINDAGEIAGFYDAGGTTHGFLLLDGTYITLDVPGSSSTNARALNNTGLIGGDYVDTDGIRHGFLRTDDGYSFPLDPPTSTNTRVLGANDSGHVVGDYTGATLTAPGGMNDLGEIVGSYTDASGAFHGFLFTRARYATIDVPGAAGTFPSGINIFGEIAGFFVDAAGTTHGFLATPHHDRRAFNPFLIDLWLAQMSGNEARSAPATLILTPRCRTSPRIATSCATRNRAMET